MDSGSNCGSPLRLPDHRKIYSLKTSEGLPGQPLHWQAVADATEQADNTTIKALRSDSVETIAAFHFTGFASWCCL